MKAGIAFEILVKRILISVGFSEVQSDGTYIYDGSSGQMLQGLGEAHNADVLLEPPVQTPFLNKIRLLVECKDYKRKVGLDVVRDALGLREDVNHFELVDGLQLLSYLFLAVCYSHTCGTKEKKYIWIHDKKCK